MLDKPIILVLFVIISLNELRVLAVPTPMPKKAQTQLSILDEINKDVEICDTPKIAVLQSNHVSKCKDIPFPPTYNASLNNTDTLLCLGLYDRAYQACHGRSLELPLLILRNTTAFETLMTEEMKNITIVLLVCYSFETNMQLSSSNKTEGTVEQLTWYNKTSNYVKDLSRSLKDPAQCVRICRDEKTKLINPLCLIIQLIDRTIQKELLEKIGTNAGDPKASAGKKEEVPKGGTGDQDTGSKTVSAQSGNTPSNPKSGTHSQSSEKTPLPEAEDHRTEHNGTPGKDMNGNKSKPKTSGEIMKNSDKTKENPLVQQQSPPLSTDQVTKDVNTPKKEAETKAGATVKNAQEETSSTVSENTGNGEFDPGMESNYDAPFHDADGVPPELDADDDANNPPQKEVNSIKDKVSDSFQELNNVPKPPRLPNDDDSHFFGYFTIFGFLGFCLFLAYHHKHKIFAMLLEGRRSRGGRARRRPSTANYRKLDCTLEEAVTSQCSSNVTHVIY